MTQTIYRYTESGLDNVFIENMDIVTDDDGDEIVTIPYINVLHKLIAEGIVSHDNAFAPKELRFLRTEMGLTQAELAAKLKVDHQTVGRWERGETPIPPMTEAMVRLLAIETLELSVKRTAAEVADSCVPTAMPQEIRIDGSDPSNYRLAA